MPLDTRLATLFVRICARHGEKRTAEQLFDSLTQATGTYRPFQPANLFIFGEHQEPAKGFQLDTVGTRPTAYARGTQMSDFEKKIWDDFWLIANDNKRAQELGIDAIQGKAVAIRAQPGKSYEIELLSTGDMTIRPIESKSPTAAEAKNGK